MYLRSEMTGVVRETDEECTICIVRAPWLHILPMEAVLGTILAECIQLPSH